MKDAPGGCSQDWFFLSEPISFLELLIAPGKVVCDFGAPKLVRHIQSQCFSLQRLKPICKVSAPKNLRQNMDAADARGQ